MRFFERFIVFVTKDLSYRFFTSPSGDIDPLRLAPPLVLQNKSKRIHIMTGHREVRPHDSVQLSSASDITGETDFLVDWCLCDERVSRSGALPSSR